MENHPAGDDVGMRLLSLALKAEACARQYFVKNGLTMFINDRVNCACWIIFASVPRGGD